MELLEATCIVGEILGRGEEKVEEIQRLKTTVRCIYQAMQSFAENRSREELQEVLASNEVFKELLLHVRKCETTLKKYTVTMPSLDHGTNGTVATSNDNEAASTSSTSRLMTAVNQVRDFSKGFSKEVGEVLGSKLGVLREVLRLPEDELENLKGCGKELERLVPLLMLAITTSRPRDPGFTPTPSSNSSAQRRPLTDETRTVSFGTLSNMSEQSPSSDNVSPEPPAKIARGENHTDVHWAEVEVPRWRLQLMSEQLHGEANDLGEIFVPDLRKGEEPPVTSMRRVVGRIEVHAKLPKSLAYPPNRGAEPQPLGKFISRNHVLWDIAPPPPPKPVQDSMEAPTLSFPGSQDDEFGCDTLVMLGEGSQSESSILMGTMKPLNPGGVHLYDRIGQLWKWIPKGSVHSVHAGDRVALVLECNGVLGCQKSVGAGDAVCVLGMEVQSPVL